MKKLLYGIPVMLSVLLLISSSSGGFVNDPTDWNNPNWTFNATVCPFCDSTPFNLEDWLNPKLPATEETVVEPEQPVPLVMPALLPYTKEDIASLLGSISTKQIPSQTYGKLNTLYF